MFGKLVSIVAWLFILVGFLVILYKNVGFEILVISLLIINTLNLVSLKYNKQE